MKQLVFLEVMIDYQHLSQLLILYACDIYIDCTWVVSFGECDTYCWYNINNILENVIFYEYI